MTNMALQHSTDAFDGDEVGEVSLPVTNTKAEAEIFSSRAAQFVEDHSIFLSEIVAEQLVLPPAHCKRLKVRRPFLLPSMLMEDRILPISLRFRHSNSRRLFTNR